MTTNPDRTETGPTRKGSTERCANPDCGHTKRDHSGRRDHTTKHPNIPLRPWCHACETDCLYEPPTAAVSVPPPAPRADALTAVRALHQPMQRGPFTICAHCSGWDGKWRCLGVVTDYPCPTIRALDGEQQPGGPCVAGEQQNETPEAEAAAYLLAVTAIEAMPGYPRLVLPEEIVAELRRLAAEAPTTTKPETGSCVHCGKTIRRIIGTLSEWWVHDPGGHTICFPEQAASSPRATPKPAAGVRQDGATS